MLNQFQSIAQAAEIVVAGAGTPQERLAQGFRAFRRAALSNNDWPVELWEKYDGICDTLLTGGTWQKTLEHMDRPTAEKCAARIALAMRELAAAVEGVRCHAAHSYRSVVPVLDASLPGILERTPWDAGPTKTTTLD